MPAEFAAELLFLTELYHVSLEEIKNIALLAVEKESSILEPRQRSAFVSTQAWCRHLSGLQLNSSIPVQLIAQLTKETSYFQYIPSEDTEVTVNRLEKPLAHLGIKRKISK